jgi:glycosyltransferase involved in cell wall biosynthesis
MTLQRSWDSRHAAMRIRPRSGSVRPRFGVDSMESGSGRASDGAQATDPRVLLFCSRPRSDAGGVQGVVESIEAALAEGRFPRLRIGPDEEDTPWTHRLWLSPPGGAKGERRLAAPALPRAGLSLVRLAAAMARFRPDVVNVHFANPAFAYFLLLRRAFGYRLILSLHGSDMLHPHPALRPHLPRFLREADLVTVVSGAMADVATEVAGQGARIHTLPNGIDTRFWSAGGESVPNLIVAAGRLERVKGFDVLIEAISRIPDARLEIYGEGGERGALERLARERGAGDRVRLPGHADRDALRSAYRRAAIFAMPSRSEGLPLALLEAMSCGVPPVASAVGGIPQIVPAEVGWTVPPEDADALAAALRAALAEGEPTRRRAARERAEPYSTTGMVERYLALYGCGRASVGASSP